ncbi:hypothetical protein [Aeoliella sp. SH292]|uniref:hypothetical protein n=1 Tax=Aeoliella sp. SH292 TaxID=3454464 RepID=UPI003F98CCA5
MSRLLLCSFAATLFALTLAPSTTLAYPPYVAGPSPAAYYWHQDVGYHREIQRLDNLVMLRKAEIKMLERQLAEWRPLDQFRTGRPVMLDVERARFQILEAKLDLQCLEQERFDLVHARGRGW